MGSRAILVCGEDAFLRAQKTRQLVDELAPDESRALGLEAIDGRLQDAESAAAAVNQVIESLQTLSFFGSGKLVWLRDATFLGGSRGSSLPAALAKPVEVLIRLLAGGLSDGYSLLISAESINRQTALYKAFQRHGEVFDFAMGTRSYEQRRYAEARLKELLPRFELTMRPESALLFLARTGTDTWRMVGELEKLRLYLGGSGEATTEAIQEVTSLGEVDAAWDLADALGDRDLKRVLSTLRRLLNQRHPAIALAALLESRVRELLVFREAMDRGWLRVQPGRNVPRVGWEAVPPAADELFSSDRSDPRKMAPFLAGRRAAQAGRYSLRELRNARHLLITLRDRLVSTTVPADILIETTLLRIAARGRRVSRCA